MDYCNDCSKNNEYYLTVDAINKIRDRYADKNIDNDSLQLLYKVTEDIKREIKQIL